MRKIKFRTFLFLFLTALGATGQTLDKYSVIAYFAGSQGKVSSVRPKMLTHIIYFFGGLNGNQFYPGDTKTIRSLVALKKQNPALKILLLFGGWGGCKNCSDVFASAKNREAFALSVKKVCQSLGTDGIDLDWEYPSIKGYPGHKYAPSDKRNLTLLVQQLRKTLGTRYEISVAAGAFQEYLENSLEWAAVAKEVNRIHLMSYDLVNGHSTVTGHHAALYSTPSQKESADNAVAYLLREGVPANKIVIGAAFYARTWQNVPAKNSGLYEPGTYRNTVGAKAVATYYTEKAGYKYFWDDIAKAPFLYSPTRKLFITYDDNRSVRAKAEYVMQKRLNGIMFWQILLDKSSNSLLGTIHETLNKK